MIRELQQKRAKMWADMQDLSKRAKDEKRRLSADEQAQWDRMDAELVSMTSEIERLEKEEKYAKEFAERVNEPAPQEKRNLDRSEIFKTWTRRGLNGLTSEERNKLEQRGTNTQITTTDGLGGYLVPDQWASSIMEQMKWYASVLDIANVENTSVGGTFRVPAQDDTSTTGAIIGQGVADTVSDMTFTEVTIDEYTYTSQLIKASWEQLNDSAYDIVGYINKKAAERIGRLWETHHTTGTGSSQPYGFVTGATAGKTAASSSAITSDEILDLIHSVDKAYRKNPSSRIVLHDSTLAALRKLTVGSADDRPIWQMSLRDGEPDTIHGVPYVVNNAMAELTDGVNSVVMAFGDFSYFTIRLVNGIEMVRLNERFADSRSVGFFAYARMGSRRINDNAIKTLKLAAS